MSHLYSKQQQLADLPVPEFESSIFGVSRALVPFSAGKCVEQLFSLAGTGHDAATAQKLLKSRAAAAATAPATSWLFK